MKDEKDQLDAKKIAKQREHTQKAEKMLKEIKFKTNFKEGVLE